MHLGVAGVLLAVLLAPLAAVGDDPTTRFTDDAVIIEGEYIYHISLLAPRRLFTVISHVLTY